MSTTPLIQLTDVTKSFMLGKNSVEILHGITLAIDEGEFVAIVGPSGSGKSTTMNLLGFLDAPTTGEYTFAGRPTAELSESALADIRAHQVGFVFQSFHLLSQKTVFENVTLPLLYRRDVPVRARHDKVTRALGQAKLEESLWHNQVNTLSGGQRQRVAIARALVGQPQVLLADEPTGSLDSKTGARFLQSLTDLNRETGTTIIMITHDTHVAQAADRVITIVDGVIESDKPSRV